MSMEQKVAVITGASQGMGAALVKAYRDRKYRVVAAARSINPSSERRRLVGVPSRLRQQHSCSFDYPVGAGEKNDTTCCRMSAAVR